MTAGVRQEPRDAPRALPGSGRARLAGVLTLLALLAGIGYRLVLLVWDTPRTNSDEATMGLAALHIARGQEFPVWFYGQAYMGALEAYLAAPVLALTGPSLLGLRLPTLALYALFVLLAWRLTLRLTGDRWFALLVVALLALGSDRIVKNQLIAGGGYPEMNPVGVALALLAYDLCAGRPGRRLPRWAAWGLLAGLMLWVDPLVLPYVVGTGVVLLAFRWRELRGRTGAALGLAALVGAAPLLGHSVAAGRNPLAAVLAAGGADVPAGWADRLHGGLLLGPPLGMGFCAPSHCATWQLWWAYALPVLLVAGAVTAWRTLRAPTDRAPDRSAGDGAPRPPRGAPVDASAAGPRPDAAPLSGADGGSAARVGAAVRLALVAAAAATLAVYVASSASGRTPVESSRYLSCLLISLPALLWPLWSAARRRSGGARPVRRAGRVTAVGASAVLVATVLTTGYATYRAAGTAPTARAAETRHAELVTTLRDLGVRHVYAGYWTCNRLTFASGEDVVCAVVDDDLRPGFDRYAPYRRAVAASAAPAWVAPTGSPLASRLDDRMRATPGSLDLVTVDGYCIYLPHA
ncbi:hypothetical protein [Micromonospora sp. WMMD812]|uniref:hypothetical protein n=1 Tax=Micromonospora sp. WMMD812 TaxID=3015152 RepID=UPI00248CE197|nr:hypothetical protein [Micromonospora sp. WMMD812]WBB67146.1 hypothetical protein O7603_29220 [Micromonospora sp. WMMD812]